MSASLFRHSRGHPVADIGHRVELMVPVRLRRAILIDDVLLVKRIIKNNPSYLENPDFTDGGNTSLHLAAIKGHVDIVVRVFRRFFSPPSPPMRICWSILIDG
jgi:hypothetical protein